jgi:hypothetical protein
MRTMKKAIRKIKPVRPATTPATTPAIAPELNRFVATAVLGRMPAAIKLVCTTSCVDVAGVELTRDVDWSRLN